MRRKRISASTTSHAEYKEPIVRLDQLPFVVISVGLGSRKGFHALLDFMPVVMAYGMMALVPILNMRTSNIISLD